MYKSFVVKHMLFIYITNKQVIFNKFVITFDQYYLIFIRIYLQDSYNLYQDSYNLFNTHQLVLQHMSPIF